MQRRYASLRPYDGVMTFQRSFQNVRARHFWEKRVRGYFCRPPSRKGDGVVASHPVRPPFCRRKIRRGESVSLPVTYQDGLFCAKVMLAVSQIIMPCLSKTARPQISTVLSPASAEQAVFLFFQRYLTSLRPNPSGRRSRQLKIHNPVTVPARFRYNFLSH